MRSRTRLSVLRVLVVTLVACGLGLVWASTALCWTGSDVSSARVGGQAWLLGHQTSDGAWGSGATSWRDTQLAVEALDTTAAADAGNLSSWLSSSTPVNLDFTARKATVEHELGIDASAETSALLAAQTPDGGFPLSGDYASDAWDTALALQALSHDDEQAGAVASALDFLVAAQNSDGGWGVVDDGVSDVTMTSEAVRVLAHAQAAGAITDAQAEALKQGLVWLSVRIGVDGSMAGSLGDTAGAIRALAEGHGSFDESASVGWLLAQRHADGGFGDATVQSTALAILALRAADTNVTLEHVTVSDPAPRPGQVIRVTATVADTGFNDVSDVTVSFVAGQVGVSPIAFAAQVAKLLPGATSDVSFNYQVPADALPGPITLSAVADLANTIPETDETDNASDTAITVRGALGTPVLASPADGASFSSATPAFAWLESPSDLADLLADTVQLDRSPTFDSPALRTVTSDAVVGGTPLLGIAGDSGLADGVWYWRVRTSSGAEASAWSTARTLTVDTVAPRLTGLGCSASPFSPNGDGVKDTTTLGFQLSEEASVALAAVDESGVSRPATAEVDEMDGRVQIAWDGTGAPVDGTYRLRVTAHDAAGNGASALSPPVVIDRTAGALSDLHSDVASFSPNGDGYRDAVNLTWATDSTDPATVRISGPSGVVRIDQALGNSYSWNGLTVYNTVAQDGQYTLCVELRDAAGNVSKTLATDVTLKTACAVGSPKVEPTILAPGGQAKITVPASDDSAVSVTIDGTTYPLADDGDGTRSATVDAPGTVGNYRIAVHASDSQHNVFDTDQAALIVREDEVRGSSWTSDSRDDFNTAWDFDQQSFSTHDGVSIDARPGSLQLDTHKWEDLGPMSVPRWGSANCMGPDGRLYVFGGWYDDTYLDHYIVHSVGNSSVYDPDTGQWAELPQAPTPRVDAEAVTAPDGKIYVIGGTVIDGVNHPGEPSWGASTLVEAFDPKTNSWETDTDHGGTLAPMPTSRAVFGIAVGHDGRIYCVGGWSGLYTDGGSTAAVEAYDPVANTWESRTPLPQPEDCFATTGVDGKIYVLEGKFTKHRPDEPWVAYATDSAWSYDTLLDTWTALPPSPVKRVGALAAQASDGRIYVYGGAVPIYGDAGWTYAYDPLTQDWFRSSDMVTGMRDGQGVADARGRIYAFGGYIDAGFGDVTVLDTQRLDPSWVSTGTYVSPVKDLREQASFGAITWNGDVPQGTTMSLATRTSRDGQTWSPWSEDYVTSGSSVTSPVGRYAQYRVTMTGAEGKATPRLDDVSIVYNGAPGTPSAHYNQSATHQPTLTWAGGGWDPEGDPITNNLQIDSSRSFDSPDLREFDDIVSNVLDYASMTVPADKALPDGSYYYRVQASDGRATSDWSNVAELRVDATPPKLTLHSLDSEIVSVGSGGGSDASLTYDVDEASDVQMSVQRLANGSWNYCTSSTSWQDAGEHPWTWNGLYGWGGVAPSGSYRIVANATDRLGNKSVDVVKEFEVRVAPELQSFEPSSSVNDPQGAVTLSVTTGGDVTHVSAATDGGVKNLVDSDGQGTFAGSIAALSSARRITVDSVTANDGVSGAADVLANVRLDVPGSFERSALTVTTGEQFSRGTRDSVATQGGALTLPGSAWELRPPASAFARMSAMSVQSGSKVYLFGGMSLTGVSTYSSAEVYDLATGEDRVLPDMPHSHYSGMAAADEEGRIYVLGGSSDGGQGCVDRYDPKTDSWQSVTPMPGSRTDGMAFGADGQIYVLGGYESGSMWALDTATGVWSVKASMPTASFESATAVLNGKCYVFYGWGNSGPVTALQVYDPATDTWTRGQTPPDLGGFLGVADVVGQRICLHGYTAWAGMRGTIFDPASSTYAPLPTPPGSLRGEGHGSWDGSIYSMNADTAASVYRYQVERVGVYTSEPLDAGKQTTWGHVGWTAFLPQDTTVTVQTRTSIDGETWSDWSEPYATGDGVESPAGRYVQWRAEMRAANQAWAPVLGDVTVGLGNATGNALTAPQPIDPVYSEVFDAAPTLEWLDSSGGLTRTYEVQVDSSPDFSSAGRRDFPSVAEFPDSSRLYVPSSAPFADGMWYWRVRATDGEHDSPWSAPAGFLVCTRPALQVYDVSAPSTLTVGDAAHVAVTVINDGATAPVTTVRLTTADGTSTVAPDVRIPALANGESAVATFDVDTTGRQGDLKLTATVDPAHSGATAPVEITVLPANIDVSVAPVASALRYGDVATFTASVTNSSDVTQTGTLALSIADSEGAAVESLPSVDVGQLAPGESRSVEATWSPAGVYPGEYRVSASVLDGSSTRAAASATFTVLPDVSVGARVGVDSIEYAAGDTVAVTSRVTNNSANAILDGATVHTTIVDDAGTTLATQDEHVDQLMRADSRFSLFAWDSSLASPGTYHAVESVLLADGTQGASCDETFTIKPTSETGDGLVVSVDTAPSDIVWGDTATFAVFAANSGNSAVSGVPVTFSVVDPASTGAVLWSEVSTMSVAQGASTTVDAACPTSALATTFAGNPKDLLVVAQAHFADGTVTLGHAVLHVEPLAVSAQLRVDAGSYGINAPVILTAKASNQTTGTVLTGASANVTLTGPNGSVLATTLPLGPMTSGASTDFAVPWNTGVAEPGTYAASFDVRYGGQTFARATTDFEVVSTAQSGEGLSGSLDASPGQVKRGQTLTFNYSLSDTGNADVTSLPVGVVLTDASGTDVAVATDIVTLSRPGKATGSVTFDTAALMAANANAPKTFSARLEVRAPLATRVLATAGATVTPLLPPTVSVDPASGSHTATFSASITASDTGSGVSEVDYMLDGVAHTYSGPFVVTGEGTHTVAYWAKDSFGNESVHGSVTYYLDTLAPTVCINPASGSYNATVSASITASDSGSGVAEVDYTLDGVAHVYSGPFALTGEGTHTVTYWAKDALGNQSAHASATYRIDTRAPLSVISPASGSYPGAVLASISATSIGSHVAEIDYIMDGGTQRTYAGAFTIAGEGPHTVEYWATDALGNVETHHIAAYRIDTTAPTVAIAPHPGSYNSTVSASIIASDSGTGVAQIRYTLDGVEHAYVGAFSVAGEGTHTVSYWAIDAVGNASPHANATYCLDTLPPTVAIDPPSGSHATTFSASIAASDTGSGVAEVDYALDGVNHVYSTAFPVTGEGTHTIAYWARDALGNESVHKSVTYFLDTLRPTVAINPAPGSYTATVCASIAASDSGSGVAEVDYTLDGVSHAYSGALSVTEGTHTVTYWATDGLGNESVHGSATYAVHIPAPVQGVTSTSTLAPGTRVLVLAQTTAEANLARSAFSGAVVYHIVDDPDEFLTELRTGIYNTFVMLDPTTGLPHDLDRELAERVFSGATFIASRSQAMDSFGKLDMLGLKFTGYLPGSGARTLTVPKTTRTPGLTATVTGKVRKISTSGASALATYSGDPVITYSAYGRGFTEYFAFDLASTDASSGAGLLRAASSGNPSNEATPGCGDVVAISTTFTNKGTTAVDAAATGTVDNGSLLSAAERADDATDRKSGGCWPAAPHDNDPDGWRFGRMRWCDGAFDVASEPSWGSDGCGPVSTPTPPTANWKFHLASGESTTVTSLVRLPWRAGTMTLTAKVAPQTGTAWPASTSTVSVAATGDAASLFADAIRKVKAISPTSSGDRMTCTNVANDLTFLSYWPPSIRALYPSAIDELLNDAASIQGVTTGTTTDAHLAIDEIVRNYEARSAL